MKMSIQQFFTATFITVLSVVSLSANSDGVTKFVSFNVRGYGSGYVDLSVNGEIQRFSFSGSGWSESALTLEVAVDNNKPYLLSATQNGVTDYEVYAKQRYAHSGVPDQQILFTGLTGSDDTMAVNRVRRSELTYYSSSTRRCFIQVGGGNGSEPYIPVAQGSSVVTAEKTRIIIGLGRNSQGGGVGRIILAPLWFGSNVVDYWDIEVSGDRGSDGEIEIITPPGESWKERQIMVPEALVDMQTVTAGDSFEIRFYDPADVTAGSPYYTINGGATPFATFLVKDGNNSTADYKDSEIVVEKTVSGLTRQELSLEQDVTDTSFHTRTITKIEDWHNYNASTQRYFYHDDYIVYAAPDSSDIASHTVDIDVRTSPTGSTLETYSFQFDEANPRLFTQRKKGALTLYNFDPYVAIYSGGPYGTKFTDTLGGVTGADTYSPSELSATNKVLLNEPKELVQTFEDDTDAIKTTLTYTTDSDNRIPLPLTMLTKYGSTTIGDISYTKSEGTFDGEAYIQLNKTEKMSSGGTSLLTKIKFYGPKVQENHLRGAIISVIRPDGTQRSYLRQKGDVTINGFLYPDFSPSTSGSGYRIVTLEGKDGSGVSTFDGGAIDSLTMEVNKSIAIERAFHGSGRLAFEKTYVYRGGTTFDVVQEVFYHYNDFGQLLKSYDLIFISALSAYGANRVFYEATYQGDRLTSEKDESGVETTYTYDAYGRVSTQTKKGVAALSNPSHPAQADITTTYVYDGVHRITQEKVKGAAHAEQLITSYVYDTAGRITSTTAPGSYTTSFTYSSPTVTTTTQPGGATTIQTLYKDGRLKSVSGTAQPGYSVDYLYDAGGILFETRNETSTSNWHRRKYYWTGDFHLEAGPSFNNGGNWAKYHSYNSLGQKYLITHKDGPTHLSPPVVISYDTYGRVLRTWKDSSAVSFTFNSNLDLDIQEYSFSYDNISGKTYLHEVVKTYPYPSSGTSVIALERFTKTKNFDSGVFNYAYWYDFHGNLNEDRVTVDRGSAKTKTVERVRQGTSTTMESLYHNGLLVESSDAAGNVYKTAYDHLARAKESIDPRIGGTDYTYNSGSLELKEIIAPDGQKTTLDYTAAGLKWYEKNHQNKYTYFQYNTYGQATHVWGHVPNPVKYVYDSAGRMTEQHTYRGTSGWTGSSLPGNFSSAGDKTTFAYDNYTNVLKTRTDAANKSHTFTYNKAGALLTRSDPRGLITTYEYINSDGHRGRLHRMLYSGTTDSHSKLSKNVTYTYHRTGNLLTVADETGTRTFNYFELNESGDPAEEGSLLLQTETLGSDFGGKVLSYQYNYGHSTLLNGSAKSFHYINSTSYQTNYSYDNYGRLEQVSPTSSLNTIFEYDYLGNSNLIHKLKVKYGASWKMYRTHTYQSNSHRLASAVVGTTDGGSQLARFSNTYDTIGRKTREMKRSAAYAANATGTLGYIVTNTYDGITLDVTYSDRNEVATSDAKFLNNPGFSVTGTTVPGAYRSYTHDAMGNRTLDTQMGFVNNSYGVNNLNQYTSTPEDFGTSNTHSYDENGNVTSDGIYLYTWDSENRLTKMVDNWDWGTYSFEYDYLGRRTKKSGPTMENGLKAKFFNNTNWTGYHSQKKHETLNYDWGSGSPQPGVDGDTFLVRWTGFIEAPSSGTWTLYLTANDGAAMRVDGRLLVNYWTGSSSVAIHFDKGVKRHLMIDMIETTGTASIKLEWSGPGQSRQVVPSSGLWHHSLGATKETRFVYNGWNLIAETDSSGNIEKSYTWGLDASGSTQGAGGVGGLLMIKDGSNTYVPVYDSSHNVIALHEKNNPTTHVAGYDYDAFGRSKGMTGTYARTNPFRHATKYTDDETGLVYYGFRYYNPRVGRFLNQDPIRETGGSNLYAFNKNNPVNNWDLLGLYTLNPYANLENLPEELEKRREALRRDGIQYRDGFFDLPKSHGVMAAFDHDLNYGSEYIQERARFSLDYAEKYIDLAKTNAIAVAVFAHDNLHRMSPARAAGILTYSFLQGVAINSSFRTGLFGSFGVNSAINYASFKAKIAHGISFLRDQLGVKNARKLLEHGLNNPLQIPDILNIAFQTDDFLKGDSDEVNVNIKDSKLRKALEDILSNDDGSNLGLIIYNKETGDLKITNKGQMGSNQGNPQNIRNGHFYIPGGVVEVGEITPAPPPEEPSPSEDDD